MYKIAVKNKSDLVENRFWGGKKNRKWKSIEPSARWDSVMNFVCILAEVTIMPSERERVEEQKSWPHWGENGSAVSSMFFFFGLCPMLFLFHSFIFFFSPSCPLIFNLLSMFDFQWICTCYSLHEIFLMPFHRQREKCGCILFIISSFEKLLGNYSLIIHIHTHAAPSMTLNRSRDI